MKPTLLLILAIFCTNIYADNWECRNDIEVRCIDGKCGVQKKDGFTPMSISFNESGKMSVCAYSGCWEGIGKVVRNKNFVNITGNRLRFSTSPGSDFQDISITLDRNDNVAMLKAGEFAQPVICKAIDPKFSDYKARIYKGIPRAINFRANREARMFRTRLKAARKGGVNFAGHFIYTSWGCGTSCSYGAIINTKTGRVYFPKELKGISFAMGMDIPDEPLKYRKDSRLFILHGNAANAKKSGVTYLVWEGTKFRQIKFTPGKTRF